jgi:hypothetical protein
MAHDACAEEPRRRVLAGEAVRRVARLSGKLAKNVQRRLIVFDDAVCSVSGTACDEAERGGSLPRSLTDERLAPQMVQQLDGAPPEGTRNM